MAGLARICRSLGSIRIGGKLWVWDYQAEKAVPASEIPEGSDRWKENERLRAEKFKAQIVGQTVEAKQ